MNAILCIFIILPCIWAQFPGIGLGSGRFPQGGFGQRLPIGQGTIFGGERSYHVRGRLVCGIQGAQGARISLWENRGRGTPFIYEEAIADIAGSFNVKAEIRNGAGFGGSGSNGYLILTINHNCEGQRQMSIELPQSYFNQGLVAVKTYDIGTINLEGRFSGEETNGFSGSRFGSFGNAFGSGGHRGGFGGGPVPV